MNQKYSLVSAGSFQYTPGEITARCDQAINTANTSLEEIIRLKPEDQAFDSTLLRFDEILSEVMDQTHPLILMGYVYPDPSIAAEGMQVEERMKTYLFTVFTRRDLYDIFQVQKVGSPEEQRLQEYVLQEYAKNGLNLSDEKLDEVREIRKNLTNVENLFSSNLNSDNTTVEFTPEELTGVPPEKIQTFSQTANGTHLVTTRFPDYVAIMDNAVSEETRKRMYTAYVNRQAEDNTRLLTEAISLRQQVAGKLGYESWAQYRIRGRMAGTPERVITFLEDLKEPLHRKVIQEKARLVNLKQQDKSGDPTIYPWDIRYYTEQLTRQQYLVDSTRVSEYFPLDYVIKQMFSLFGELLGVEFEEDSACASWAAEVSVYRMVSVPDHQILAYVYLDLFPREGKFGHLMMSPLNTPRLRRDGSYEKPVCAIVANFPSPTLDRPSLLLFNDVEGLFHEFGHVLHGCLTRAPYGLLSGTNTELDYTETPSQAMEEWIWTREILNFISGHYLNHEEKLPADMRDNLIASRDIDIGLVYARQWVIARMDMEFSTVSGDVDIISCADTMYRDMMDIEPLAGGHEVATIGHFAGGYDAGYYSYLWSKIYALNVFSRFREEGVRNTDTGADFRHGILEPGNMKEGMILLRGFLGREPGVESFVHRIIRDF